MTGRYRVREKGGGFDDFGFFDFSLLLFFFFCKKLFENHGQSHKVGHIEWARPLTAWRWILCTGN